MKHAKIVIGLNYGDESKGLMTDFFCRQFPATDLVLNVRYNGGAQAGHTVVTEDGRRHVFSHFGAGSFSPNVITVFDKQFIINPILYVSERKKLEELGVKIPHTYSFLYNMISTPLDMMVNQFLENARGEKRNGSCGIGINQTVVRHEEYPLYATPLKLFIGKSAKEIVDCLTKEIKLRSYFEKRMMELGLVMTQEQSNIFYNDNILYAFAADMIDFLAHTKTYVDREEMREISDYFVFEGAQGLLLDRSLGVHTTPSHPGLEYIVDWFDKRFSVEVCFVSRTYFTKHGAGPFETECPKEDINPNIFDITNQPNEFQGTIRYGYFDLNAARWAVKRQDPLLYLISSRVSEFKDGICFTHMNETQGSIKWHHLVDLRHYQVGQFLGLRTNYLSFSEKTVEVQKNGKEKESPHLLRTALLR